MNTLTQQLTTKKVMSKSKKALIASMVITAIASTSVSANEQVNELTLSGADKKQMQINNENIGFGTGAVVGGIVAGPIGAFVAGIGGTLIAKIMNVEDDNEALSTALTQAQLDYQQSSEQTRSQYQAKLQRLESSYQQQLVALENQQYQAGQLQAENLLMSLQFSTGSSDIAPHYQEQVSSLAQILNNTPSMKIDLSGYTDLTGEASLNQALSQARVESVKNLLMAQGVGEQQISTFAFGEDSPVVANNEREVSFYDRRVVLKLHKSSGLDSDQMANNN